MATVASIPDGNSFVESDYGSDFSVGEEDIVSRLLEDISTNSTSSKTASAAPSLAQSAPPAETEVRAPHNASIRSSQPRKQEDRNHEPSLRSPYNTRSREVKSPISNRGRYGDDSTAHSAPRPPSSTPWGDVRYPDLSHALPGAKPELAPELAPEPESTKPQKDDRSPLERFRSFPKRPLTVSDLASGAWCELQYSYTLTLLPGGRKTRTAAMKGGTHVHQTLEDQVHTTVQVNVTNKEEAFALRMWNVIQGLRTLRDSGMTRELEVWGIIDGQIVNGIIDEVSHESPNAAFEQELSLSQSSEDFIPHSKQQASIMTYLESHHKKVYLTDVKTRASERLPTGAALRPARVQLFLYHRLLGEMASGLVDFTAILGRYGLRAEALFSDAFMAQVGDLHDEIFYDADSDFGRSPSTPRSSRTDRDAEKPGVSPDMFPQTTPPQDLIKYRSIAQMLPLLQSELRETFPQGAATLGELLAVQYRHRDDGRILGVNSFPNDPGALEGYLRQNMQWWRGEREAEGVIIEETYKCRSCEFAESCQWRKDKEAEFLHRKRGIARRSS
ncbi:exonuclease V [Hypomontagnella submonticulosa]|nr:exonuclease V [Hypomontagnella submonticulosa]